MATEAEALASILAWSADSPNWQRDALRRLIVQMPPLESDEIDELIAICKGEQPPAPLEAVPLIANNQTHGEVFLRQVHYVKYVNALEPTQPRTSLLLCIHIISRTTGPQK